MVERTKKKTKKKVTKKIEYIKTRTLPFETIDENLTQLPKDIVRHIYKFYDVKCKKCGLYDLINCPECKRFTCSTREYKKDGCKYSRNINGELVCRYYCLWECENSCNTYLDEDWMKKMK